MKAVILAGGYGTRLAEETKILSKRRDNSILDSTRQYIEKWLTGWFASERRSIGSKAVSMQSRDVTVLAK